MLPFDNNMMLLIAIALVIAAVAYLYRDLEKTKTDLSAMRTETKRPAQAPPVPPRCDVPPPKPEVIAEDEVTD